MRASAFARVVATVVTAVLLAAPVFAQDPQEAPPAQGPEEIDATKLGVSLERIQKGLRLAETPERRVSSGLRLNFQIQVYGQAPKIDLLKDFDPVNGQVPGTAPTHKEMVEFMTPQMFRTPAVPISSLLTWAAQALANRSKKAQCEAEIDNYRALLMQGVNVAAPRCAQE